ncbi:hypothetical protein EMIHUDRAFT_221932 [Emiliania huxleyi CCMP1516]|uniref:Methyltransferase domain-containing protein n=2 Tax=Emiliania huxleyi TaxID=2903 RepID=A0A0D3HXN0_EMIH1|nr:hypothetical protein EMIHUDRAFT_221932 [Emiliania huxleyi CCMP1516]EOD03765.1 hypothetical protein EMIHUDRAFT_221932 [Emiliania huxleyi CCMP1516]|eukprot:XP_005756194.1 hypothetical protein EMIHUDRAFT_221932 [Emiliania huxleyi CCMP1516]
MAAEAEALHWRKVAGQTSCRRHGTGPTGGFCMSPHRQQDKRLMNYCLPKTLAASLAGLFANQSVLDLGCGLGQYGRYFRAYAPSVRWQGLDGAENVQEATGGLVQFADLSEGLPRQHQQWYDWKLSIEVAEHLPRHMEPTFMFNLASKVKHGVVISWARLGQHGNAHVNCQSDAYVRCAFQLFGLSADETLTQALRATIDPIWRGEVTLAKGCMWLAHTLMAFRVRNESRVDSWRAHSPLARYLSHRAPHHVGVSQTFVDHYLQETAILCPLVNSSNRCDPKGGGGVLDQALTLGALEECPTALRALATTYLFVASFLIIRGIYFPVVTLFFLLPDMAPSDLSSSSLVYTVLGGVLRHFVDGKNHFEGEDKYKVR